MEADVEKDEDEEPSSAGGVQTGLPGLGDLLRQVRRAVGLELLGKVAQFAVTLVDLALKGHIHHVRLVLEMLEQLVRDNDTALLPLRRSIAEEWGAEPEWNDGCCIHCAKVPTS